MAIIQRRMVFADNPLITITLAVFKRFVGVSQQGNRSTKKGSLPAAQMAERCGTVLSGSAQMR